MEDFGFRRVCFLTWMPISESCLVIVVRSSIFCWLLMSNYLFHAAFVLFLWRFISFGKCDFLLFLLNQLDILSSSFFEYSHNLLYFVNFLLHFSLIALTCHTSYWEGYHCVPTMALDDEEVTVFLGEASVGRWCKPGAGTISSWSWLDLHLK